MTRYFVDITQDRVLFADSDGVEIDEVLDLRVEVCRQLGEIVRDWVPGLPRLTLGIAVRDEAGTMIMQGTLRIDLGETA